MRPLAFLLVACGFLACPLPAFGQADAGDWPMYNRDLLGTRCNSAEQSLGKENVGKLEEKWRFPRLESGEQIGVIHATPIVVNGYVYFGTATDPAFYKLTPDGRIRWSYRNPTYGKSTPAPKVSDAALSKTRFQSSPHGILGSAVVTMDAVYFSDLGGWIYALDRATGAERWKLNSRDKSFPDAHPINLFFASPIIVEGKLIVAGGTLEQVYAASPSYKGCTGRGFVVALQPETGKIIWKYNLGPKPEPFDPPMVIKDSWGEHKFYFGPATSSIWSTPSYDADSGNIFFGTDVNTAPRRPTAENPKLYTRESCGIACISVRDGSERWITQINPDDVWTNAMRSYDPKTGRYKDQSIGDTPKIYTIDVGGTPTKVVGVGCKNGGFYVFRAADGHLITHTPIYTGPPNHPSPEPRTIALPSAMGGLQTGCATDGATVFTNGIDAIGLSSGKTIFDTTPPTGGRVVAISLDTKTEKWRHDRPKLPTLGGPPPKIMYKNVGDPVASGIAVANGVVYFTTVASGKLVALDAQTGTLLKDVELGPVWSGPSVSRGRVYVGTGNTLFTPIDAEAFFPKRYTGALYSFGLPGDDEVSRLGSGSE
jgi:polyvinyl alcohol dehydrogenase (cytochrome)